MAAGDEVSFEMELPHKQLRRQDSTGLDIVLRGSRERHDEATGKAFTTYTIHVNAGKGVKWDTEKRYSEFRDLKTGLVRKHAGCAKLLPDFPSRVSTMSAFTAVSAVSVVFRAPSNHTATPRTAHVMSTLNLFLGCKVLLHYICLCGVASLVDTASARRLGDAF